MKSTLCYSRSLRAPILLLGLLLSFATAFAQRQENLVGTWQWAEGDVSLTLKLNGDGTGALNDSGFKYVVHSDQLLVEDGSGERSVYVFQLSGNALTVSGGSLPRALTFTRQGGGGGGLFEKNIGTRSSRDANDEEPATPIGTWERRDAQQVSRLVLNEDGTGALNGQTFRWTLARGVLNLIEGSSTMSFNASFDSKTLTLKRAGDARSLVFSRIGKGANPMARHGDGTPRAGGGLIGRWRSTAATVQINDNGTLTINGERFRYSVQGDVITLTGGEGSARVKFQLSGDTLVTDFNGDRNVYTRAAEGEAESKPHSDMGGGVNPPELVGKWCYISVVNNSTGGRTTDRCFTLYANGSYEYYGETSTSTVHGGTASQESDSGTWSATATTITANSRKQGRLVFRLEKRNHPKTGDPMLVLDGDAFVTYNQRPSWP